MSLNEEGPGDSPEDLELEKQYEEEDAEEVEEVDAEFVGKQKLSDTFMTFLPKNTSSNISKQQIVDIQIPKSEWVLYLNKAYIYVDLIVTAKIDVAVAGSNNYIGLVNSACIFDQISINNGRTLFTDTFCQVNSRIWQMSKSDNFLKANPSSFINYTDASMNEGFLLIPVKKILRNGVDNEFHLRMRIPLGCLFNCFDNCEAFSTTQLNENVTLSMQLSNIDKYMCLVTADANHKITKIAPIDTNKTVASDNTIITINDAETAYKINDIKLLCPCHYPNEVEKVNFDQQVKNGLVVCNFRTSEIQAQSANFGRDDSVYGNFSTGVRNMFGIFIAISHNNNYTIFDKPYINNIECNLSEVTKLANGKVHVDSNYNGEGNDMYTDLVNYFGDDAYKELNRFDESVTYDYLAKYDAAVNANPTNILGSYIQFYKIAAGEQIGFDADYFANMINYKCKVVDHRANYGDSTIFCCQHSFKQLIYVEGAIDIVTPFRDNLNYKAMLEDNNVEHGIGALITTGLGAIGKVGGGLIGRISGAIKKARAHKNDIYAYTNLGKDLYEKHKDILSRNITIRKRRFKKFIKHLKEAEASPHGLLVAHGGTPNNYIKGETSPVDHDIQGEQATDYDLMNLKSMYRPIPKVRALDKNFKMRVPLDYKLGLNKGKLYITSFGRETALHNTTHGLRDRIRARWHKFINWFKTKGKGIASTVVTNLANTARQYVSDIITGKIKLKDVPAKFKNQVMEMLRTKKFTGTNLDPVFSTAIDYATNVHHGVTTMDKIPSQYRPAVQSLLKGDPYFRPGESGGTAPTSEQRRRMQILLRRKRLYEKLSKKFPGIGEFNPNVRPISLLTKEQKRILQKEKREEFMRRRYPMRSPFPKLPQFNFRNTHGLGPTPIIRRPKVGRIFIPRGNMKSRLARLLKKYEKAKTHGMPVKPKMMRKLVKAKIALMNPRLFKESNFRLIV